MPSARKSRTRLGVAGYVEILAALKKQPLSTRGAAEAGICGRTAANVIIPSMHREGLLRIVEWEQRYKAAARPVYAFGGGNDAPAPEVRTTGRPVVAAIAPIEIKRVPPELLSFFSAIEALGEPMTRRDICSETGWSANTVRLFIAAMLKHRLCHVDSYQAQSSGGAHVPRFRIGRGADAVPDEGGRKTSNRRFKAKKAQIALIQRFAGKPVNDDYQEVAA